jgi:hypothetical protein
MWLDERFWKSQTLVKQLGSVHDTVLKKDLGIGIGLVSLLKEPLVLHGSGDRGDRGSTRCILRYDGATETWKTVAAGKWLSKDKRRKAQS